MAVHLLVQSQQYETLHQMLQYQILNDSERVAQSLLQFVALYPPFHQLALDMLKRLRKHDLIIEVLLSRHQVKRQTRNDATVPFINYSYLLIRL
jgi:hypothetical protein